MAANDHVNVFLYDGAIVPDPENIITGGHDNTTARMIAIREGETINATALEAKFEQTIGTTGPAAGENEARELGLFRSVSKIPRWVRRRGRRARAAPWWPGGPLGG